MQEIVKKTSGDGESILNYLTKQLNYLPSPMKDQLKAEIDTCKRSLAARKGKQFLDQCVKNHDYEALYQMYKKSNYDHQFNEAQKVKDIVDEQLCKHEELITIESTKPDVGDINMKSILISFSVITQIAFEFTNSRNNHTKVGDQSNTDGNAKSDSTENFWTKWIPVANNSVKSDRTNDEKNNEHSDASRGGEYLSFKVYKTRHKHMRDSIENCICKTINNCIHILKSVNTNGTMQKQLLATVKLVAQFCENLNSPLLPPQDISVRFTKIIFSSINNLLDNIENYFELIGKNFLML